MSENPSSIVAGWKGLTIRVNLHTSCAGETSPNKVDAYNNEEVGVRWQKYLAKSEL